MRLSTLALAAALTALAAAPAHAQLAPRGQAPAPQFSEDEILAEVIAAPTRSEANRARDAHRRPFEAMTFWGLQPGLTVIEIDPGAAGWWTEILAPYAARTGGGYVAAWIDTANPETSAAARTARAELERRLADPAFAGAASAVDFGPRSGVGAPDASADLVLVARAFHNWARQDLTDRYMAEFFRVLKPGGVLAVEQHRAPEGSNPDETAPRGYVSESYVIQAAQRAGFLLDARSELNANAADTRDHPFGVWTLPPVRRSEQGGRALTAGERAHYDAIGESDRMTLRFRKPE